MVWQLLEVPVDVYLLVTGVRYRVFGVQADVAKCLFKITEYWQQSA
jgi:hypothetical protein